MKVFSLFLPMFVQADPYSQHVVANNRVFSRVADKIESLNLRRKCITFHLRCQAGFEPALDCWKFYELMAELYRNSSNWNSKHVRKKWLYELYECMTVWPVCKILYASKMSSLRICSKFLQSLTFSHDDCSDVSKAVRSQQSSIKRQTHTGNDRTRKWRWEIIFILWRLEGVKLGFIKYFSVFRRCFVCCRGRLWSSWFGTDNNWSWWL